MKEQDKFILDINSYKEKRDKNLERLAKRIAREVITTKVDVKLDNMNSYERKVIHNKLSSWKDVKTHSEGEGSERVLIVEPKE